LFAVKIAAKIIKISLRSKGDFNVNQFARKHFEGGGHINAAGGKSDLNLKETTQKFEQLLADYENELKNEA
jgi:phosphoesterase RecJ-like protein